MSTAAAKPPEKQPQSLEANPLARELASAFHSLVEYEKEQYRRTAPEALAKAQEPCHPNYEDRVLRGPPEEVSWLDLELLAEKNPALMTQRWEEIKEAAREDLQSGHRAARTVEGYYANPWKRAQFLAIRGALAKEWQPRNGIEWQLIDTLAQAQTALFSWQESLAVYQSAKCQNEKYDIEKRGDWNPLRVSEAEAIEQAAAMIDRFNKIFLRTLRALRDLRRYTPTVVVQNAGQINVAGQQLNVARKRSELSKLREHDPAN
jgi:hypothetical protein